MDYTDQYFIISGFYRKIVKKVSLLIFIPTYCTALQNQYYRLKKSL